MLTSDLREQLNQYTEGNITLDDLQEWLTPRLPIFASDARSEDAAAASLVELSTAEINDDIFTEADLRTQLRSLLEQSRSIKVELTEQSLSVRFGTSAQETTTLGNKGFVWKVAPGIT